MVGMWSGMLWLVAALAQTPTLDQVRAPALAWAERMVVAATTEPVPPGLAVRDLFTAGLALAESGQFDQRLDHLLARAEQMQDTQADSPTRLNFRWSWRDAKPLDGNAVDFCLQSGSLLWLRHRDKLPAGTRTRLESLLRSGLQAAKARAIGPDYTNIALMNAGNLILLGEALDVPDAAETGYQRLNGVALAIWDHGISEYNSPNYYGVDLDDLGLIEAYAERPEGVTTARALLELFARQIGANWFTPTKRLSGPCSRDYDYLRGLGIISNSLWLWAWPVAVTNPGVGGLVASCGRWRPTADALQDLPTTGRRIVRCRYNRGLAHTWTNCLLPSLAIGSAGAPYGTMDIPLCVQVAGTEQQLRAYFIADGRADPYGKTTIPEGNGHAKTLHLTPLWSAVQAGRDVLAQVRHRDKGMPEGAVCLNSDFVLPGTCDELWLGNQLVSRDQRPWSLPVQVGQAVVWRQAQAVIGLRVLQALGSDGTPAPIILTDDGNRFGALRLSVQHGTQPVTAGQARAVLWVRADHLAHPDHAAAWLTAFASAKGEAQVIDGACSATAEGLDGPLELGIAVDNSATRLIPAPPSDALEVDGREIGRELLAAVPAVAERIAARAAAPVHRLDVRGPALIEAEAAYLQSPMVAASDLAASGGKFIWCPGEIGHDGGGNGSATYMLEVARAGHYRLEGRMLLPTPKDDSFHISVGGTLTPSLPTLWTAPVCSEWTWAPYGAIDLPAGRCELIVSEREDGSKLDCLRLTSEAAE